MSFEEAVETHTLYLTKLSYLYVHNQQIAEDVVQDVFIKLYRLYGDNIPLENTKAYLVKMTMNRCRDYFRSWHYRKVQFTANWGSRVSSDVTHTQKDGSLVSATNYLNKNTVKSLFFTIMMSRAQKKWRLF